MAKRVCSVAGCERPERYRTRAMCVMHYQRAHKYGTPHANVNPRFSTPRERFAAMTEVRGDCLVWTGVTDEYGYARLMVEGKNTYVHRYSWEQANGPIPEGVYLDHTCWNPSCCNPEHLRLATPGENSSYRKGANRGRDLPRNVYRHGSKYQASVWHKGGHNHLGTFETIEAAAEAAESKREELFGIYAGRADNIKENHA